jgi:hypothetical protein
MDAKTFDKTRLPSRHVTEGPSRAPHRSYYYAMGLSREQIHQPFVGVATCWNEAAPCNIALMRQAQSAKRGVKESGGTPREFCTITVTDGIAMGHEGMKSSLVSREVIADSVAPRRLSVVLLTVFAVLALLLASVGIYGVMSFLVVQRTHEIGVRMALGAQRADVLRLIISRAGLLIGSGTVIGLAAALLSTRLLRSALYETSALDLTTFVLVTITLALVALLASYVPARRATRSDPMIALGRG